MQMHSASTRGTFTEDVLNAPTTLAPRVRALVVYLAAQQRRIVGVDELREAAWHGTERKPKRIAHYIAQARRGLGDCGREPRVIRTVYGVGYQFIGPMEVASALASASQPTDAQRRSS